MSPWFQLRRKDKSRLENTIAVVGVTEALIIGSIILSGHTCTILDEKN